MLANPNFLRMLQNVIVVPREYVYCIKTTYQKEKKQKE